MKKSMKDEIKGKFHEVIGRQQYCKSTASSVNRSDARPEQAERYQNDAKRFAHGSSRCRRMSTTFSLVVYVSWARWRSLAALCSS